MALAACGGSDDKTTSSEKGTSSVNYNLDDLDDGNDDTFSNGTNSGTIIVEGSEAEQSNPVQSQSADSKVTSSKESNSKVTSSKATSSKTTSSKGTSSKTTSSKVTSSKVTSSKAPVNSTTSTSSKIKLPIDEF